MITIINFLQEAGVAVVIAFSFWIVQSVRGLVTG